MTAHPLLPPFLPRYRCWPVVSALILATLLPATVIPEDGRLPGTESYRDETDLAAETLAGIHRFFQRRTRESIDERKRFWARAPDTPAVYAASVEPNRKRLRDIIGAVDERVPVTALEYLSTTAFPSLIAQTEDYAIHAVRWPVFGGIHGEGLLLAPHDRPTARVVALPDADVPPESLAGLVPGTPARAQFARRLAENGCLVLIPTLVSRDDTFSGNEVVNRFTNQPHREWIHRQAFQFGRHPIGFEVQKVLAAVDWFTHLDAEEAESGQTPLSIGVAGYGEGGMIGFHATAVDPRIDSVLVSGYFAPREELHSEPIYRNLWGILREFGDAEIATLIAPRTLVVEASPPPFVDGPPEAREGRTGAAPGAIPRPDREEVRAEFERARELLGPKMAASLHFEPETEAGAEAPPSLPGSAPALERFLTSLGATEFRPDLPDAVAPSWPQDRAIDELARQERQIREMEDYIQRLMGRSAFARANFFWTPTWKSVTDSEHSEPAPLAEVWSEAAEPLRDIFWNEVIGRLPDPSLPPRPRSRIIRETDDWTAYLVVLDVWPDVISWGYLLLPEDLREGERRPVVVCQHGLGGTPENLLDPESAAYRAYAARLAERGFVVYVPYNPNAAPGDIEFRQLQRRANPLKCSIFSVITGQHSRILEWLSAQPFVDPERIGFYGLSYGGKTAMRVPALLEGYALSICSGDFNEWARKIVSPLATTRVEAGSQRYSSYMFTREYEIMEFNQGHTFNYAEMAALIAPRPFMVERGQRDLVASDEWVAFEYATVRRLYADLDIPERTEIEYFDDGHVINAKGSFDFLHRHLDWPVNRER